MKPLRRNGLKDHQHLAQGIALGRKTNIILYLSSTDPLFCLYNSSVSSLQFISLSIQTG